MPSAQLLAEARGADAVVASDLPRAVASAERLAFGRDLVTSPLLREIRLEPPRWVPLPLPIRVWDVLSGPVVGAAGSCTTNCDAE